MTLPTTWSEGSVLLLYLTAMTLYGSAGLMVLLSSVVVWQRRGHPIVAHLYLMLLGVGMYHVIMAVLVGLLAADVFGNPLWPTAVFAVAQGLMTAPTIWFSGYLLGLLSDGPIRQMFRDGGKG